MFVIVVVIFVLDYIVCFVVLGDFGEGNIIQCFVFEVMEVVCSCVGGFEFVVGLGDNIYDDNLISIYSMVFEVKFELFYDNLDFLFFMLLGNYDNDLVIDGFGSFNYVGDIQVVYI